MRYPLLARIARKEHPMVQLTVNGRAVEVPAGATLLEATRQAGVHVPTLCYHPRLPVTVFDKPLAETACISCGQCTLVCPT